MRANIQLHRGDCLEAMKAMRDNQFELAIVDPPYGIERFKKCSPKDIDGAKTKKSKGMAIRFQNMEPANNKIPTGEYFDELIRVSKNQIIWGGNYFLDYLGMSRGMIFWDKMVSVKNFADGEFAWVSEDRLAKCFKYAWGGLSDGVAGRNKTVKNINPFQKPVALYKWLLSNYAQEGDTILDTHLGSGSIAIACHDLSFGLVGYELDEDYYAAACARLDKHKRQGQFDF